MLLLVFSFAILPYVILQCMPGWRSFVALSIILISFEAFEVSGTQNADGPGVALGLALFFVFIISTVAGIISRALTLYLASRGATTLFRIAVSFLGVLLIPAFLYAPKLHSDWQNRPPGMGCKYDVIPFSVGDEVFNIPGVRIVSADQGDGEPGPRSSDDFFTFHGNKDFRRFCGAFGYGGQMAIVNAVTINFFSVPSQHVDKRFGRVCRKAGWPDEICNREQPVNGVPGGYPNRIAIYDSGNIKAGHFGGGWNIDTVREKLSNATLPSDVAGLKFDGYKYYHLGTARNAPLPLSCHKSRDGLYCSSDEPYAGDVYLHFEGLVSAADPIGDALALRETARNFVTEYLRSPQTLP